jgi:hypothetical protein
VIHLKSGFIVFSDGFAANFMSGSLVYNGHILLPQHTIAGGNKMIIKELVYSLLILKSIFFEANIFPIIDIYTSNSW